MQGVHSFVVEIDADYYKNIEYKNFKMFNPYRGGNESDLLPKHGKVVGNLSNQDTVKEGDTLFFIGFRLYDRQKFEGKVLVDVKPEDAVAYAKRFPKYFNLDKIKRAKIRPLSFAVGRNASLQAELEAEFKKKGLVPPDNLPKWKEHIFDLEHDIPHLNCEKGDRVWVYVNSDYPIDYIENRTFLEHQYITFNETKQQAVGNYVIIAIESAEKESKLILDKKVTAAKGLGRVINAPEKLKDRVVKGDLVKFHIANGQVSPINPMIFCVPYNNIICKFDERDNQEELREPK